ncbi:MAG TPA: hypothetical protein VK666_20195 [Chryseolinea sp.]|nr:hypothetical protein [Chryseolinea sp.]
MQLTFWQKNKVFLLGLLAAFAAGITPFVQTASTSEQVKWTTVGFAAGLAILSYLAKEWRGQGLSIVGILGNAAGVITTLLSTGGHIDPVQLVLQLLLSVIAAAGADPKSRGYEQSTVIKEAKKEGEEIQPASLTAKPK